MSRAIGAQGLGVALAKQELGLVGVGACSLTHAKPQLQSAKQTPPQAVTATKQKRPTPEEVSLVPRIGLEPTRR